MKVLAINGGKAEVKKDYVWHKWPDVDKKDEKGLVKVLYSGKWCKLFPGNVSEQFEKAWSKYQGAKYSLTAANGTVTLVLALRALGVKIGDEVITTPITFIATVSAISEVGAIPVFAEVDGETGQITAEGIEAVITKRTKAVMGVHYGGYPFDLDKVKAVCKKHKLFLIEDCAHAQGTEWRGIGAGAHGDFGSFSFQETKSLAAGEGGVVTTNNKKLFDMAGLISNIGRMPGKPGYLHYILSSNYRLSEFQSAILLTQLDKFKKQQEKREENANWLREHLSPLGLLPLREDKRITRRGFYFMVLRYQKEMFGGVSKETFLKAAKAEGLPIAGGYGVALYRNPCFNKASLKKIYPDFMLKNLPDFEKMNMPVAEKFNSEQITIPQTLLLCSIDKLKKVVEVINKIQENVQELKNL